MSVTLIDAHHHLWDLKKNPYPWLQEATEPYFFLGNYDALKNNYLWSDYQKDTSKHNVIATVHCEAEWARDDQVGETQWLTEMHTQIGIHVPLWRTLGFTQTTVRRSWQNRLHFRWLKASAQSRLPHQALQP